MKGKNMNLKNVVLDLGKGLFASAVTGVGLAVGRDVYVYAKEKVLGKKEQPTLVRIAADPITATANSCCNQ
jgi:hypothetical protein